MDLDIFEPIIAREAKQPGDPANLQRHYVAQPSLALNMMTQLNHSVARCGMAIDRLYV